MPGMPIRFLFRCFFTVATGAILAIPASAQKKTDTLPTPVDSSRFFYFTASRFSPDTVLLTEITHKLHGFQYYHARQINTGNIGSAEKAFSPYIIPAPGFSRGRSYFDYFGYDNLRNRKFFSVKKPYTRIVAVLGQKQEQVIAITHAQNIGKNLNVAFGFDRIRSDGFYLRQNTNNTAVNMTSSFRGPGKRYALLTNFYWTSADVAENGGIVNDELFEDNPSTNRQLIGVKISSAETNERKRGAWIKQYRAFGEKGYDTISRGDSAKPARVRMKVAPRSALYLETSIEDRDFKYFDTDTSSGVYSTIYRDSAETNDSTHLLKMDNAFGWQYLRKIPPRDFSVSKAGIGIRHQFGKLNNDTIRTTFSDILAEANLRFTFRHFLPDKSTAHKTYPDLPGIYLDLFSQYVVSGTHAGDMKAITRFSFQQANGNRLSIGADWTQREPDWLYKHYSGNHYRWQNDFSKTGLLHAVAEGELFRANLKAGLQVFNYSRPLYFDSVSLPAQLNGDLLIPGAFVNHKLKAGWFNLWSEIQYNRIADTAVIRIPELVVRESVFADFILFKKALMMQIGADVFYHTTYYADDYNPNLAQYQLQSSRKFGNYPFVDLWLSIKIKPVRIFVKMEHLNSGLMGNTYYFTQHYPQNDRALKVGFSWIFND
ncbi:MAG: hypothetical protein FD123_3055 [Bacteroidetes bacterium]|nr:MAG: hypothetical protein FD123_3055 [Bacteroidota bacterium]